ncbi:hypothetical protein NADFUDRAFT_25835 [Nadsonia fulvescens var. elongata DSM 6958]|uniref:Uncharacterized protein n=1 Tax=Nadsonia fulvescens var. elongata DSM 6958 TaxID=857566 RepID=A0A1E3PHL2_9ASCO|nr:hypothetical protein NADFUDRAFT_25835 [Nadsonia fulvescens var. elongata DSM 6958]
MDGTPYATGAFPSSNNTEPSPQLSASHQEAALANYDRLDENNGVKHAGIPSIPIERAENQREISHNPFYGTMQNVTPPLACMDYYSHDQGVSSPSYARLTMYNVPASQGVRSATELPLGLIATPFAKSNTPVPFMDYSASEVPRCQRCRAYVNPMVSFIGGGTRFVCNLCQFPNTVSSEYFAPTDASSRRIDADQRAELCTGTYDFIVPKDYYPNGKTPTSLTYLFVIDVTEESIKKEFPRVAASAIRLALFGNDYEEPSIPSGCKVGIMTFDRTVHFYNLNKELTQAQMIIMSDITDPYCPLEEGLFVDPQESRNVIEDFLDRVDSLFSQHRLTEPVYGTALESAYLALKNFGGKVSFFLSGLPSLGLGQLAPREDKTKYGTDKEVELLNNTSPFYREIGLKFVKAGIGMDLFVFANGIVDLANVSAPCKISGGHLYLYPRFDGLKDGRKFIADFVQSIARECVYNAAVKVRSSTGLQVSAHYGNFDNAVWEKDPEIGTIDADTTFGVMFKYDGQLDTKLDAHFQISVLYTSADGIRKVRVINICAGVSEQVRQVFKYIDCDAAIGIMARHSLSNMKTQTPKQICKNLNNKLVEVLASYKKNLGYSTQAGQLLIPISLRPLTMYILSLQKTKALGNNQLPSDPRVFSTQLMNSMSVDQLSLYLYPRIIGLHNLSDSDASYDENNIFRMPPNIVNSMQSVENGGVYLAYDGKDLILWLHQNVSPLLLKDLFGEPIGSLGNLDPYLHELPELDTPISKQARALIDYFKNKAGLSFLSFQVARMGYDAYEMMFAAMMVEDRYSTGFNYPDYVAHIYRHINLFLENNQHKAFNESKSNSELGLREAGL